MEQKQPSQETLKAPGARQEPPSPEALCDPGQVLQMSDQHPRLDHTGSCWFW